MSRLLIRF
jgi:hypothetical protein